MKKYYIENDSKTKSVYCTDDGTVAIEDLVENKILYTIKIFNRDFTYLEYEWNVAPCFYFSPDEQWLVITYGIGYVYFVDLFVGMVAKEIRMFEEINYSDDSYKNIDTCCYYNEYTQIDFSASGQYVAIRVRGDFDPQESDGRQEMFTPIYFRSVFVYDVKNQKMIFSYAYDEDEERHAKNLSTIAFSPNEQMLVTGVLGGEVKAFDLLSGAEMASFQNLIWVAAPCDIDNRKLVVFINDDEFVFVNDNSELVIVQLDKDKKWIIKNKVVSEQLLAYKVLYDIECDNSRKYVKCYGVNSYGGKIVENIIEIV